MDRHQAAERRADHTDTQRLTILLLNKRAHNVEHKVGIRIRATADPGTTQVVGNVGVVVEAIRGVSSGEMIRSIMYKGMVKITGRAEILGRPMLYGTTKKFLDAFGLNSLKDLPKIEELKKPKD